MLVRAVLKPPGSMEWTVTPVFNDSRLQIHYLSTKLLQGAAIKIGWR